MEAEDPRSKLSLLDLARQRNKPAGPECGVSKQLRMHPLADQLRELLTALTGGEVRYADAAEACKASELPLSADMLSRHCRNKCSCEPAG